MAGLPASVFLCAMETGVKTVSMDCGWIRGCASRPLDSRCQEFWVLATDMSLNREIFKPQLVEAKFLMNLRATAFGAISIVSYSPGVSPIDA